MYALKRTHLKRIHTDKQLHKYKFEDARTHLQHCSIDI